MKTTVAICLLAASGFCSILATSSAHAEDEPTLEHMATCQESWLAWQDNPARGDKFMDRMHADYREQEDGGYLVPKAKKTLFGLPVGRVYLDSVGMGVGFSVLVNDGVEAAKNAVEKAIGRTLTCEADSDGIHACQAELGPKRTVTVASDTEGSKSALIGCFYFYEK